MFSGNQVRLDKPQISDADIMQKWYLDREFRRLYNGYRGNAIDMIMSEIKEGREITDPQAKQVNFIVKSKYTNEPIGMAAIMDIDRQNGHAAIALGIADAQKRLSGYGIDLMIVLCDIVFYQFGFNRCYMSVSHDNHLGLRSATSFGFQVEGKLREHEFVGGQYVDVWQLGLLKREYENIAIVDKWKKRGERQH